MPRRPNAVVYHLSTAAGFESVIERAVTADVAGLEITSTTSGLLRGRARSSLGTRLAELPYLSVVLAELAALPFTTMADAIPALAAQLAGQAVPDAIRRARTFRVRIADGGQLVAVDARVRADLERRIVAWSGLRPEPRGGNVEVWVTHRRDDPSVSLAVRLDRRRDQTTPKGALRPELAAALVRVVPPEADHVVVDPFAGSGAIPIERARYPYRELYAADIDAGAVRALRRLARQGVLGDRAHVAQLDVAELRAMLAGTAVDQVITDPPWGLFQAASIDLPRLYRSMWAAVDAVLAPDGTAVVLTGALDEARGALGTAARGQDPPLVEKQALSVLVNGKKATVLVVRRPGAARAPRPPARRR